MRRVEPSWSRADADPGATVTFSVFFLRGERVAVAHRTAPMAPAKVVGTAATQLALRERRAARSRATGPDWNRRWARPAGAR